MMIREDEHRPLLRLTQLQEEGWHAVVAVRRRNGSQRTLTDLVRLTVLAGQIHDTAKRAVADGAAGPVEKWNTVAALTVRSLELHAALIDAIDETERSIYASLSSMTARYATSAGFEDFLNFVCEQIAVVCDCTPVLCSRVRGTRQHFIAAKGVAVPDTDLIVAPNSPERLALNNHRLVLSEEPGLCTSAVLQRLMGNRRYYVLPLVVGSVDYGLLYCSVALDDTRALDAYLSMVGEIVTSAWRTDSLERELGEHASRVRRELDAAIADAFAGPGDSEAGPPDLTGRENEVLDLLLQGVTNAEIATTMFVSVETVKSHVKHILRKCGATNRSELIARFAERPPNLHAGDADWADEQTASGDRQRLRGSSQEWSNNLQCGL
ncbi:LuxR C-terminal-related transcriptional regulator [Rhodococcus sp. NPDC127530]|uniref:LuxR C-terminal-related transcriptional regulator n=1 Tax=unclassified Rhodococcus (in: high G+C Gram-positive bacteria) TaxID=192944 RepID=UPI003637EC14